MNTSPAEQWPASGPVSLDKENQANIGYHRLGASTGRSAEKALQVFPASCPPSPPRGNPRHNEHTMSVAGLNLLAHATLLNTQLFGGKSCS